jgi:hypothetical protein
MKFCCFAISTKLWHEVCVSTATFHMTPAGCLISARALTPAPWAEPLLGQFGTCMDLRDGKMDLSVNTDLITCHFDAVIGPPEGSALLEISQHILTDSKTHHIRSSFSPFPFRVFGFSLELTTRHGLLCAVVHHCAHG